MNLQSYVQLMRFHKPIGIVLLWCPIAWAFWVANHGMPSVSLLIYFLLGTVLMRAAGCVLNDIADRHVDQHVQRTRLRPLVTGEVRLLESLGLTCVLLLMAFFVLMQLPRVCFYYALMALFITVLYPFCKRFFIAPQFVLGLAFSMGMPMAYAALGATFDLSFFIVLSINILWIVSYDTMYAMVDRTCDLRLGIQSTAIWFGAYDRLILSVLQCVFHGLWLVLALINHYAIWFYAIWCAALGVLIHQQRLIRHSEPTACLRAFSISGLYGMLMWLALMV